MWAEANIEPSELGVWALGLGVFIGSAVGILSIAVLLKQLFKQPPVHDLPVTRRDWEKKHEELAKEVRSAQADLNDVKRKLDAFELYSHERNHSLLDGLQPILTKIDLVNKKIDKFLNGGEKP